jgi:tRNA(Ile)-lysidine synthetase-like protein
MQDRDLILDAIDRVIRARALAGQRLVVAISGGADSVALALGLHELRECHHLDLYLAHVDHGLRAESAEDAAFVRLLGEKLGLPTVVYAASVPEEAARRRTGIEDAARIVRYRFLAEEYRARQAAAVLVGHTADDQVETRLLHVARGSGLRGLAGMAEDSTIQFPGGESVRIVRPLLAIPRSATVAFCRARGIEPRRDPTNGDLAYARNRVRHAVVPALQAINPRLGDALERLAQVASEAEAFIEAELNRRLGELATVNDRGWSIDRHGWRELPLALKRALLRRAASSLGASGETDAEVGAEAIERAIVAADGWPTGKTLTWPGGLLVSISRDSFTIGREQAPPRGQDAIRIDLDRDAAYELGDLPSELVDPDRAGAGWRGVLRIRRADRPCPHRSGDRWHADLDRATLDGAELMLRSGAPGDRIAPEGMNGRKKVQDLLVDAHLPRAERVRVPILATPSDVAWVVGLRRDRRFLAGANCQDVRCLKVEVVPLEADPPRD